MKIMETCREYIWSTSVQNFQVPTNICSLVLKHLDILSLLRWSNGPQSQKTGLCVLFLSENSKKVRFSLKSFCHICPRPKINVMLPVNCGGLSGGQFSP